MTPAREAEFDEDVEIAMKEVWDHARERAKAEYFLPCFGELPIVHKETIKSAMKNAVFGLDSPSVNSRAILIPAVTAVMLEYAMKDAPAPSNTLENEEHE